MNFKLLAPQAVKDARTEELTRQVLRTKETEEAANKANIRLAKAEADFASLLASQREKWAKEQETHLQTTSVMEKEVKDLESRKEQALIPLEIYKTRAESTLKEAQEILLKAKGKEETVEDITERLENRLDEVAEREKVVSEAELKLNAHRSSILSQEKDLEAKSKGLLDAMQAFYLKKSEDETRILKENKEIQLWQANLEAREGKVTEKTEALRRYDLQLKDERGALDRAWKELDAKRKPK